MEELIEKYPYDSMEEKNLFKYLVKMNKFYNNSIRQKIKFKGKKVDFGRYTIDVNGAKIFSQFIHLSSFSEKDKNFYIPKPCENFNYNLFCKNCIDKTYTLKHNNEDRAICIYRISLLKLFKQIFFNINNGIMNYIDIYEEEIFVNSKCKKEKFVHIRYNDEKLYYYIKLKEIEDTIRGNYYSIFCAFPVFNEYKKRELDRIFNKVKRN